MVMINDFFAPGRLENVAQDDFWLQQVAAECHVASERIKLLKETLRSEY